MKTNMLLSHLFLFLMFLSSPCLVYYSSAVRPDSIAEYGTLLSVKSAITDGDSSLPSWNTSTDFCIWRGVMCDGDNSYRRRHVIALNLSRFQLTGTISPQIGKLRHLSRLDLSLNNFSGSIPHEIFDCKFLTYVDLSGNHLSGEIPIEVTKLSFLKYVNLSRNDLGGHIPASMPRSLTVDFSYNENLSRPPSMLQLWVMDFCVVFGSLMVFVVIILACRPHWKVLTFHRLDLKFSDVLASLHKDNILGRGDLGVLYMGRMLSGNRFVVKRLPEVGPGWFMYRKLIAEIRTLGNIRYRHFVRILGFYSNFDENLLVYEYMTNGSLDEFMHRRKGGGDCLAWRSRYEIVVAVAKALCYLHHRCSPPIIHGKVTSSKIMLDTDFKGRLALPHNTLASFLFFEDQGTPPIAGDNRKVDEKSDVYDFGVVLLEVLSGRPPWGDFGDFDDFDDFADIVQWVRKEGVLKIIDPILQGPSLSEVMHVFDVAMLCVEEQANDRPTMLRVVEMLTVLPRPSTSLPSCSTSVPPERAVSFKHSVV